MDNETTDKDIHANLDVPETPEESPSTDRIKVIVRADATIDVFLGETLLSEGDDYDLEIEEGAEDETVEVSESEEEKKNEGATDEVATPPVQDTGDKCPVCGGRGLVDDNTICTDCNGSGKK